MAQFNSLIVTGNSRFLNPINGDARNGVYYVKGTQTAATGAWTGNIPVPALYDGLTIMYYLPYNGSGNATLNLTLSNSTTTGAVNCYYGNATRLTTHYSQGSNIVMTYHSAGSISINGTATTDNRWIANANYADGNNAAYVVTNYYNSFKAGANKVFPYTIIMQCSDGRWESIVTSSSTGTSKARNTHGFRLGQIALMYANATYTENANIGANTIYEEKSDLIDHRYSFNTANDATNGTTAVKPVYLVGTVNATDGLFYLDTTWWTQTLPSTADGKVYIYLGDAYDYYRMSFRIHHPIYCYTNGMIRQFAQDCATVNGVDISTKMDKTNPTGSGSFSLNRKSGSSIGINSFAEGFNTTASGAYSHAEGQGTTAGGSTAHAEGYGTTASGPNSHVEGYFTTANSQYSHAEGSYATASGYASHAEGYGATASGPHSHAEGWNTTANHKSQHVFGEYNTLDDSTAAVTARGNYVEIVGNGTNGSSRSNARTLDWSGNEVLSGTIEATGFGTTLDREVDRGGVQLTQAEYDELVNAGTVDANTTYFITDANNTTASYAAGVTYDNTSSGLNATNVQAAIEAITPSDTVLSAAWIAQGQTTGNTPLTDYLTLTKGFYFVIVAYPVLDTNDNLLCDIIGGNITKWGGSYIQLSSQQSSVRLVRVNADTRIRVNSMQSKTVNFTYLDRGGLFAYRLRLIGG